MFVCFVLLSSSLVFSLSKLSGNSSYCSLPAFVVGEFHVQEQPPKAFNFIKKQTLAQVFSCEFLEILRTRILQNTSGRLLLHVADEEAAVDSHQADKTVFEKEYTEKILDKFQVEKVEKGY